MICAGRVVNQSIEITPQMHGRSCLCQGRQSSHIAKYHSSIEVKFTVKYGYPKHIWLKLLKKPNYDGHCSQENFPEIHARCSVDDAELDTRIYGILALPNGTNLKQPCKMTNNTSCVFSYFPIIAGWHEIYCRARTEQFGLDVLPGDISTEHGFLIFVPNYLRLLPHISKYHNDKCFYYADYYLTWRDAQNTCRMYGSDLLEHDSQIVGYFINKDTHSMAAFYTGDQVWLGGTVTQIDSGRGQWVSWASKKQKTQLFNWQDGHNISNYTGKFDKHCLMTRFGYFTWYRMDCREKIKFICQLNRVTGK